MHIEKAITYSLLAHIRNNGSLIKGTLDIFIPLIKRVLSKMNSRGVHKGESLLEIQSVSFELYKIEFPIPVLKLILTKICDEINTKELTKIWIYGDGSFSINEFTFEDFEEVIDQQNKEIKEIEVFFEEFCKSSELPIGNSESIFKFIEKNKFILSKYLNGNKKPNGEDFTAEAQFVNFFKQFPTIYERIKNIYLGSIISSYIEFKPENANRDIELLLDTNFLVGLIDLNTPESTHTCRTLIDIAKSNALKLTVLMDTIEETKNLLDMKALYFDKSFLQKKVNSEDVFNACDRRGLNKADLERIADNLETIITELGVNIIYNTDKLKNEARFSNEYKRFQDLRSTKRSALHDAIAILYVKQKRKRLIKKFEDVNCWFVNNSTSIISENIFSRDGTQPETIKVDDLLNILWLSNPQVEKSVNGEDLAEIGLTSLISFTLNKNIPKANIIRELDDNIHKYSTEKEISDIDIVRVATRITSKQLKDVEELNRLAETNKEEFVKRLEHEAQNQKRVEEKRIEKLEELFVEISKRADLFEHERKLLEQKNSKIDEIIIEKEQSVIQKQELEKELLKEKNKVLTLRREDYIEKKVKKWRQKSWMYLILCISVFLIAFLYLLSVSNWKLETASLSIKSLNENSIISGILSLLSTIFNILLITNLYNKYCNHSNIQSFKNSIKFPEDLKEIKS